MTRGPHRAPPPLQAPARAAAAVRQPPQRRFTKAVMGAWYGYRHVVI
ncbi:hypothetical protein [Streptosporangium sp. NPDC049376]